MVHSQSACIQEIYIYFQTWSRESWSSQIRFKDHKDWKKTMKHESLSWTRLIPFLLLGTKPVLKYWNDYIYQKWNFSTNTCSRVFLVTLSLDKFIVTIIICKSFIWNIKLNHESFTFPFCFLFESCQIYINIIFYDTEK